MSVFKATIQVTLLLAADNEAAARAELERLDLEDLHHEMDDGAYVGTYNLSVVEPVPADRVDSELEAVGSDGTFFSPEDR